MSSKGQLARVRVGSGRFYLDVGGVVTAVAGSLCYDPRLPGKLWTRDTLEVAAEWINEALTVGESDEGHDSRGRPQARQDPTEKD